MNLKLPKEATFHAVGAIFKIDPDAIRIALKRKTGRTLNQQGVFNTHGGNNKVLTVSQEDAILSYCFDQYEAGLGATFRQVFAAIGFLKTHESPPKVPPSWTWFIKWLTKNPTLYTIRTKPIAYERVESHTEQDIKDWFKDYRQTLEKYRIKKLKRILNIDESGARITCLKGEKVIVSITVKEMYTLSPKNR